MKLLDGKNVIITGASRGIGNGIARILSEHGANIAFTYLSSESSAKDLEENIKKSGVKCIAYKSDASDFNSANNLVESVIKDFGSIDILINNAGVTKDNLLLRMNEDDWNNVIKINLNSVFNLTKSVLHVMLKQRSGSIINISSVVGIRGNAGQSNYSASKSGIIGFSKSVALEVGSRNIRCNVVAPGFIETEMTSALDEKYVHEWKQKIPLKRLGKTNDVANCVLFLSSDLSSYITGQVFPVCGGMLT